MSVAVVIFQGEIDEISPVIQWNTSLITKTAIFFVFRNVLYYEAIWPNPVLYVSGTKASDKKTEPVKRAELAETVVRRMKFKLSYTQIYTWKE